MSNGRTQTLLVRTPEGIVFSFVLAGPLIRFLALSIDLACIMVVANLVGALVGLLRFVDSDTAVAVSILSFFIISLGYGILLEWRWRGQTLGKRLLGLRVIDAQGLRLQFSQVVIRNLLRAVDSLPVFYLVGGITSFVNPWARRLGDIAANTLVVRVPKIVEPDLDQVASPKYNSFRDYPHLVARLRQLVSPREAGIALQAILRREEMDPEERIAIFRDMADHFRSLQRMPEDAVLGLTDEQYVRNVVDVVFVKDATRQ